ncbi:MAG: Rrf2 family transcriptional regulator [bacterium]|nr:Rrf2 family transcriptional regulator [bacterium]
MQITSKFTAAVHILACIDIFGGEMRVTSGFLSGSTGVNAVIVRNILGLLRKGGIVETRQGSGGAMLARPSSEITLYHIYKACDCASVTGLFRFHENPNAQCPVGRNIHKAMDPILQAAQNAMEEKLKSVTLAEVVASTRNLIAENPNG